MKTSVYILLFIVVAILPGVSQARDEGRIIVEGREKVTVTTPSIRLSDMAKISSSNPADDDAVIGLQRIAIAPAPPPGESTTIPAALILERLEENQVNLERVGYRLYRSAEVFRAGREISAVEIRTAIEQSLLRSSHDASIRRIIYNNPVSVAPGMLELEARGSEPSAAGRVVYTITARVDGEEQNRFQVEALVDAWRTLPVASRTIERGMTIEQGDVKMARLNLSALPIDAVGVLDGIVGMESGRRVSAGEAFRLDNLSIPAVVNNGEAVTLMYKSPLMTVTASGTALQSGYAGEEIRVRNDGSKRVVVGKVLEAGLVKVN